MRPFQYARATTLARATAAAREAGTQFIAGGTNIIDLMKDDVERPAALVDINALPYRSIDVEGDMLVIGSLARMSDVAGHPVVRSGFPAIAQALDASASPQLRNMASIGGNVLQRTRCAYFRDVTQPCNKRNPGSGCGAIGGDNRMEAVLGISDRCIAAHASDLAVALSALDARVRLSDGANERDVRLDDFYLQPGSTPQREHDMRAGELIVAVAVPTGIAARSLYIKVRDRSQYEFAIVSVAAAVQLGEGRVAAARIALGGVGTVPWRSRDAEAALVGKAPTAEAFRHAAAIALRGARGSGQNDFKIELAQRTVARALRDAASLSA